jgi:rhomboid protease GluP
MLTRQETGSVLCPSCGQLVGVKDERCYHCGRRNPGLWGYAGLFRALGRDMGFVPLITGACILLYALTLVVDLEGVRSGGLTLFAPSLAAMCQFGAGGAYMVFGLDRWWTVLSAGWLHGGVLHLAFNMMWVRSLGGTAIELYGPGRTLLIYTGASVAGFGATSFVGAYLRWLPWPFTGAMISLGASAAIFGLLGALYRYGQRTGGSHIGRNAMTYAVMLGAFGLVVPLVDNWAHLGGFAGGYVMAVWLDPLKPERLDHLILGLLTLVASAAAVIASVVAARQTGCPLL